MIDFHAHILPGLDDGIQTMEEAEEVLKEAKEAGVKKIICTTHYSNYYAENEETRKNKLKELQSKTDRPMKYNKYTVFDLEKKFKK